MKSLFTIFALFLAVIGCQDQDQPQRETWWINSAKVDCTGVGPMSCYQIQKGKEIKAEEWSLLYDEISGFEFEPGFIYQLEIEVSEKATPVPADASSLSYKLIDVVSKTQDARLALTNIWKVFHVGRFQDPKSQQGEALIVEINGSQGTYVGNTDCNSIRGGFSVDKKNEIKFGPGASTMMACPSMEVEMEVKHVLEQIRKYKIENNTLYLQDESGQALMSLRAVD
jgi:heat shock protein HslJ